ncbi:lipoprotein NlpD [Psychromonas marina]|uniref:Lipoprotein NlpD n=1 Tax=Psychromonas marina TaxID=88364 RepID=A0ABQ6E4F5_9GAMM|nr:lipoprotein NlpD [Psychromonas marina]
MDRAPVSDLTAQPNSHTKATDVTTSRSAVKKGSTNKKTYKVQKGDTLYSIGWKTGLDVNTLVQHNNLKAPYIIKVGQTLQLTNNKIHAAKKVNNKSDLPSQNVNKTSNTACTGQNCQKNKPVAIAQEKTKAYSTDNVDKRSTVSKKSTVNDQKVSDWQWPVKGKLTKKFSASLSGMQGISIVNDRATPIYATASGQVVYAGNGLRGYGNLIIIKHNFDYLSAYAHNETLLVRENEVIKKGQKIATMGDSGTGHVHLHFEIRYRGKSVDPLRYLPKR